MATAEDPTTTRPIGADDHPSSGAPLPEVHPPRKSASYLASIVIAGLVLAGILWFAFFHQHRPTVALVTSGDGPYWDPVIAGAQAAAREYDVNLIVDRVKSDQFAQSDALKALLAKNLDGIAVSPLNASIQANLLADVASKTTLVTVDSDSPVTGRLCFVGTDNYAAGRDLGAAVRQAVPDGGEIVLCLGTLDKENTVHRRQGVIDELLDRPFSPGGSPDPIDATLKGAKYTIVATIADGADHDKATPLAVNALRDHPNIKCFVGLLSYSAPAILEALNQNGKAGKVKVVGFDADPRTLAAVESGAVYATIVQDQFGSGYHAVRILADAARGVKSGLPLFQMHALQYRAVRQDNLAEARRDLHLGEPTGGPQAIPAAAPSAPSPAPTTSSVATGGT